IVRSAPIRRSFRSGIAVEDEPRDAVARGSAREGVDREPPRVLELLAVELDLAAGVPRHEADHELARERPVLTSRVAEVRHLHADLLADLAVDGALETLAVVDEAGDQAVAARDPVGLAGKEDAVAVAYQRDHGRVEVRVVLVAAPRTPVPPR